MAIPVSLEDAKRQLRHYDEELTEERQAEIVDFIADAAAWAERYTGHILQARTVTEHIRVPGRGITLSAWPIKPNAAFSVSAGGSTAVIGARLDVSTRPARVWPAAGRCWPITCTDQFLTVTVRAGYEDDDVPPGDIRRAMLVLIAACDADREGGDLFMKAETTARALCRDLRLRRV